MAWSDKSRAWMNARLALIGERAIATTDPRTQLAGALADWWDSGLPLLRVDHKYAAALAMTAAPPAPRPWPTCVIELPAGLFPIAARWILVSDVCVWYTVDKIPILLALTVNEKRDVAGFHMAADAALQEDLNAAVAALSGIGTDAARLISNFIRSAFAAVSDPGALRDSPRNTGTRVQLRRGAPCPQTWHLGKSVKIDLREHVRALWEGRSIERGGFKTQWIVCGHWRNQAHGTGRAQRRLKWIEPHWKGPEDAPINFRAHKVIT